MPASIPIYHLASHARAGETLALKLLGAHSLITVPLQIEKEESGLDQSFVQEVREEGIQSVPDDHPYARERGLSDKDIIVVKQGVWHHRAPFQGVTLVRNPLSFVDSMLTYNVREGVGGGFRKYGRKRYRKTFNRLLRWCENMSQDLYDEVDKQSSVIDALSCFYNHRVLDLLAYDKPVIKYEDMVADPQATLRSMCEVFGVAFEDQMLSAHQGYEKDSEGHGMNDLSRSIDTTSLEKWRKADRGAIRRARKRTAATAKRAGYTFHEPYLA